MMAGSAAGFVPSARTLPALRRAAAGCQGCELWRDATQTVFGEGRPKAELILVGEQPGDSEDRRGKPFVGPAGAMLQRALDQAGIERDEVYITNAVKHFKWRPRGKRRIHQTPRVGEIEACKPWLEAEVEAISPLAVVAMGATATRSVFGPGIKVMRDRGRLLETPLAPLGSVTIHPSAILRAPERQDRHDALEAMVADLEVVARAVESRRGRR